MSSNLHPIPNEMWELIVSFLLPEELWHCRGICKAVYTIAYKAEMRCLDLSHTALVPKRRWQLTQLDKNPSLSAWVTTVHLTPNIKLKQFATTFAWLTRNFLRSILPIGTANDSVVLRNLPNVISLKVIEEFLNDRWIITATSPRRCSTISTALSLYASQLTHLELWLNSRNGYKSYCPSAGTLSLPKLRVFKLWNECLLALPTTLVNHFIQGSYHLEELHLRTYFLGPEPLSLPNSSQKSPPRLQRLTWSVPEGFWPDDIISPLLLSVKEALTDLTLFRLPHGLLDANAGLTPFNFEHLISLRLCIEPGNFTPERIFRMPSNVRNLVISTLWWPMDGGTLMKQFLQLLSGWQSLECLTIRPYRFHLNFILTIAQSLPVLHSLMFEFSN
ncbi:hypothetical protein DL96DRAFT_534569 [Flagelloscypha sp. PMI_526]|nr:hypothetical protein DL96DRAFT_534569 [Flagelloscypha sp. PMI_526]